LSEQLEKPADFQPVEDPQEAIRLLKEGAKTMASAMVWSKDQKHVVHTHLTLFSDVDRILYAWSPKGFDPSQFMDQLAQVGSDDCFFSLSLSRANLFFKSRFLGVDGGGIKFSIPAKIYKVQRRKDMRFTIPDGHVIRVDFNDPMLPDRMVSHKILDLSASGLAFLVEDAAEAAQYQTGLILKAMTFTIKSKTISVEGEVRHSRPMGPDSKVKGVKVGVLFKNMRGADNQVIASFVFEESRKFLSRFM